MILRRVMQRIADTIRPDGGERASGPHKIGTTKGR